MDIVYQPLLTVPQPMDFRTVDSLIAALCGRYRGLRAVTVGASVLERPLRALVLSAGRGGSRQRVLIAAAFHGQEWLTALCALRLCEELCRAGKARLPLCDLAVEKVLEEREIWFLPLVNPDGADITLHGSAAAGKYASFVAAHGGDTPGLWQANARGVDINHNFNAGWAEMQALAAKNHRDAPANTAVPPRRVSRRPGQSPTCAVNTAFGIWWRFTARGRRSTGATAIILRPRAISWHRCWGKPADTR